MAIRIVKRDMYARTIDVECPNGHCRKPVHLHAARVPALTDGMEIVGVKCDACSERFDIAPSELDAPIERA